MAIRSIYIHPPVSQLNSRLITQGEVTYRLAAAVGFTLVGLQFTHRQHPSSPLTDLILNIKVTQLQWPLNSSFFSLKIVIVTCLIKCLNKNI